jgi:Domain of unknown function (DUF6285)
MQERPNKLVLLTAIARFLMEEVRPALSEPRLAFRALIAANLASVVASELASDSEVVARDLERLAPLLPDAADAREEADPSFESQRARVADLNARLASGLRDGGVADDDLARVAAVLRDSLREKLAVDNPRFDTSLDIE